MRISFSIRQRLLGVGALSLALVIAVAAGGYWGAMHLTGAMEKIALISVAQRNGMLADMTRIALHGDVMAAVQAGGEATQKENASVVMDSIRRDLREHVATLRESIGENAALPLNQDIKDVLEKAKPSMESYIMMAETINQLAFENNADAVTRLPEYINSFKIFAGTMLALGELMEKNMKEVQDQGKAMSVVARNAVIFCLIAAMLAMAILSLLLTRSITRPLLKAVHLANMVASGDLTSNIEIKSTDETGRMMQSLKDMNDSLHEIIGNVRISVDSITIAAKEIAAGNSDLSQRTEEQASSLQETASSMEELSSTVKHNAENSRQANQMAKNASDIAVTGGEVVGKVVVTMASINESSRKIVDIISVIEGIAFQTNILALNAAVEAARAGEQGRGFAVVASEVRNLAQRSAAAAKEIKALIDDSVGKVDNGSKLVDQAGKTMGEIVIAVKRVTDIMAEISAASMEQSAGIDQVNQAITQMDEVTQQNAALVEEAAAAAESMEEEAENLARSVSVFKLGESVSAQPIPERIAAFHPAGAVVKSAAKRNLAEQAKKRVGKPKPMLEKTGEGDWEEF